MTHGANGALAGPAAARLLWQQIEPVHVLTYFAPEARQAADSLGMRGFWMGYFAQRSAPLGQVTPETVTATFFGFAATRVRRALPAAWDRATPVQVLAKRREGWEGARARILGARRLASREVAEAADLAWQAAGAADTSGRPLAAANQALDRPAAAHLALWQAVTTLREHRGDGHNALLVATGIGPVQAHALKVAAGESPQEQLTEGRGHGPDAWHAAIDQLRTRGWLDGNGQLTSLGRRARADLERGTDEVSLSPWRALGSQATQRLSDLLGPLSAAVIASGEVPYPNPAGITRPGEPAPY
jgi:hypothetical protein